MNMRLVQKGGCGSRSVPQTTGVALRATPATHPRWEPGNAEYSVLSTQYFVPTPRTHSPLAHPPLTALLFTISSLLLGACHRDMRDQPRYETLETSPLFANRMSARAVPKGTVPRGHLADYPEFETGRSDDVFVQHIPLPLDRALVTRGQERFNIYCSPCHGRAAVGDGMIVRRGFRKPPSLHIERLQEAPAGHFFDVMTRGFGVMPAYGAHIKPHDRWAIVAYVRALQLSQNATLDDVPTDQREKLTEAQP